MFPDATGGLRRHALALAAVLTAAGPLGGCGFERYRPEPIDTVAPAQIFREHTLDSAELHAFLAASGSPIAGGSHPWGLTDLVLAALYFHPDMRVAQAQWRLARAAQITAAARPNPTLTLPWEHHGDVGADQDGPWSIGLALDFVFERRAKRAARREQAAAGTEVAAYALQETAWQLRSRVRAALVQLARADEDRIQADRRLAATGEGVALLERRAQLGEASGFEVSAMRLELQQARLDAQAVEAKQTLARIELGRTIGLHPDALRDVQLDLVAPPALPGDTVPDLPTLQDQALTGRPDVLGALRDYAAREAALHYEIERQYPDLNLSPGYLFDQGDHVWSLGAALVLPLLNRNEGPIAEAQARRALSAREFESRQFDVVAALHAAHAAYVAAAAAARAAEELAAQARAHGQLVTRQFELGFADRLDVVRARIEILGAERAAGAAQYARQDAYGRLEQVVGRPLDGSAFIVPQIAAFALP